MAELVVLSGWNWSHITRRHISCIAGMQARYHSESGRSQRWLSLSTSPVTVTDHLIPLLYAWASNYFIVCFFDSFDEVAVYLLLVILVFLLSQAVCLVNWLHIVRRIYFVASYCDLLLCFFCAGKKRKGWYLLFPIHYSVSNIFMEESYNLILLFLSSLRQSSWLVLVAWWYHPHYSVTACCDWKMV